MEYVLLSFKKIHFFRWRTLFLLLISLDAYCFTLFTGSDGRQIKFTDDEVKLNVANDTCSTLNLTATQFLDLIMKSAEEYWNSVPTTRLKLVRGSVLSFSASSLSTSDLISSYTDANTITIACNDNASDFNSSGILAVTRIGSSGGAAIGAIVVGDHSTMANLTEDEKIATVAHEIGHAIGLGHSNDEVALMYYSIGGKIQMDLTRDDHDAITWLYPNDKELGGCLGSMGTITTRPPNFPSFGMGIMTFLALMLISKLFGRKLPFIKI